MLTAAFLLAIAGYGDISACTSFMLDSGHGLYFVHSLNQGDWDSVPGIICINQRDVWKKGYSFEKLLNIQDNSAPSVIWKSQYGSVTFNPFGREFPDGGMNEAGLFIWEMSFDGTMYPGDEYKPKLFMLQWMQYVLDNYNTVGDVIENAERMAIDGWEWHFFVADKSGATAIIDFIGGKPVVYTGSDVPLPLCCNSPYPVAMNWLKQYQGFGGELEIKQDFEEIPRFIYGAKLMSEYKDQDPIKYSFDMLEAMSVNVRWSVVFDVKNSTVYYNTNLNKNIRHFKFTPKDFAFGGGPLMLNIEHPGPENIRGEFVPYNREMDRKLMHSVFLELNKIPEFKQVIDKSGGGIDAVIENFMNKVRFARDSCDFNIEGLWKGNVSIVTGEGEYEMPVELDLRYDNSRLTGTLTGGQQTRISPLSNVSYRGGLLYFTVLYPDTGELFDYRLHVSTDGIKGGAVKMGSNKIAYINLSR